MKKPKTPAEFQQQVEALGDDVLECRDTRHWYRPQPFYRVQVEGGPRGAVYLERLVICERCEKASRLELFRVYRDRIERLEARPKYEKGYLLHGVPKGVRTTEVCRLEQIRRTGLIP